MCPQPVNATSHGHLSSKQMQQVGTARGGRGRLRSSNGGNGGGSFTSTHVRTMAAALCTGLCLGSRGTFVSRTDCVESGAGGGALCEMGLTGRRNLWPRIASRTAVSARL